MTSTSFGIAKIALHQPEQVIANHWYGESLPKKFVNHTGIEERHISFSDEVTMAVECIEQMLTESAIKQDDCAGLIFVTPSFVPMTSQTVIWTGSTRDRNNPQELHII